MILPHVCVIAPHGYAGVGPADLQRRLSSCRLIQSQQLHQRCASIPCERSELLKQPITLAGGLETWHSTAWSRAAGLTSGEVPADYQMELLRWFRGMEADLIADDRTAALHAEVIMQRPAKKDAGGSVFNPFSIFGSGKKAKPKK